MKCPEDQKAIIEEMQRQFADLKKSARKLMAVAKAADDANAYRGAYATKVAIEAAHVVAGDRLCECFEDGPEIVIQGPGR